jgi:uncharacterized membrane protein
MSKKALSENRNPLLKIIHHQDVFEEVLVSFAAAFLILIDFSLYRQFRGILFSVNHPEITAGYIKFVLVFLFLWVVFFFVVCFLLKKRTILDHWLFYGGNLSCILIAVFSPDSFPTGMILLLIVIILNRYYFILREHSLPIHFEGKSAFYGLLILILFYSISSASVGIIRHRIFLSSGNDLGTFDQMFYSMSKTLLPWNTITGIPINQFTAVHFSPILYLLLPGYLIFRSLEYLIFMQSLFTGLAAIPLFRLCRLKKISSGMSLLIAAVFLLQRGILGGLFKDFHENALLPFFLLSFIYFFEKNEIKKALLFLLLTLFVKEDAMLYILCYGFYTLLQKKFSVRNCLLIIGFPLLYFIIVSVFVLNTNTFAYRYANLISGQTDGSFFQIIKILFTNPLYLFSQCFSAEKLQFMGWIFFPLMLIPLLGLFRQSEVYLFIPMVLLNLLPTFYGQYSIDFQYHFGTISLFCLILIRVIASIPQVQTRRWLISTVFAAAVLFSSSYHISKTAFYTEFVKNYANYQKMEQAMKKIPTEAVVTASNHIYPHLSARNEIYSPGFHPDSEYVAMDLRGSDNPTDFEAIADLISSKKYGTIEFVPDWYLILKKDASSVLDMQASEYLETRGN